MDNLGSGTGKDGVRVSVLLSISLIAAFAVTGQGVSPSSTDYYIGPGDLLEITVDQDPSLDGTRRVNSDGRISMPVIGSVELSGLTPTDAEDKLRSMLEKYMTRADVIVAVREFENRSASIFGEVRKPGKVPVTANMTLLQAISAAGGLSSGHGGRALILRLATNGLSEQIEIDIDDLMLRGNPDLNVPIRPNDVINIPADPDLAIYLLGEVMKPGVIKFKASDRVTLLRALAAAGGLTDRANTRSIIIKRVEGDRDIRLTVHLGRIISGKDDDILLQHNDTIYVRESFF